jgi:hypothetical protein
MLVRIVQDAALTLLGLLAGAMLLIGVALVGYWESLEPAAFLEWFATHSDRIGVVMIPLGVAASLAAVASAAVGWREGGSTRGWSLGSAALAVLVVVVYFAAHAPRNAAFAARATPLDRVAGELATWGRWHWVRVWLGIAAFAAQLLALRSHARRAVR